MRDTLVIEELLRIARGSELVIEASDGKSTRIRIWPDGDVDFIYGDALLATVHSPERIGDMLSELPAIIKGLTQGDKQNKEEAAKPREGEPQTGPG